MSLLLPKDSVISDGGVQSPVADPMSVPMPYGRRSPGFISSHLPHLDMIKRTVIALLLSTLVHVHGQTLYTVSVVIPSFTEILEETVSVSAVGVGADGWTTYTESGSASLEVERNQAQQEPSLAPQSRPSKPVHIDHASLPTDDIGRAMSTSTSASPNAAVAKVFPIACLVVSCMVAGSFKSYESLLD
ncbi:hypothetical protein B0H13DRAFT_2320271 [Mycena leptocephala]|nr:hypothetical protein B0H13DRAFT_2320271 [Mycena leptocephala]